MTDSDTVKIVQRVMDLIFVSNLILTPGNHFSKEYVKKDTGYFKQFDIMHLAQHSLTNNGYSSTVYAHIDGIVEKNLEWGTIEP
jgi:hypothetical protein